MVVARKKPAISKPVGNLPKWQGMPIVLLAGGKSLTLEQVELVRQAHEAGKVKVIAINRSFELAPWADMLYAHDKWFWSAVKGALRFQGLRVAGQVVSEPGMIQVAIAHRLSGPLHEGVVHVGYDSGYQAMQVAHLCGGRPLILLGYDARNNGNWHDGYGRQRVQYEIVIPLHNKLKQVLDDLGTSVINATPESALTMYETRDLAEVLGYG